MVSFIWTIFDYFSNHIFIEILKAKKSLKQDRTKLFNQSILGLNSEDEEPGLPPPKKPRMEKLEVHGHLDSTFIETEEAVSTAPLPEYSFTKGKTFYCVWWNLGQKDFKCHFTESAVDISFTLPKLTIDDLEEILGYETTMNFSSSHEVKWRYELPPQTKLELSKESLTKIETEKFFGFSGKIVHVVPELTL